MGQTGQRAKHPAKPHKLQYHICLRTGKRPKIGSPGNFKVTVCLCVYIHIVLCIVLGIEPRAFYMVDKHSTTEQCAQPFQPALLSIALPTESPLPF